MYTRAGRFPGTRRQRTRVRSFQGWEELRPSSENARSQRASHIGLGMTGFQRGEPSRSPGRMCPPTTASSFPASTWLVRPTSRPRASSTASRLDHPSPDVSSGSRSRASSHQVGGGRRTLVDSRPLQGYRHERQRIHPGRRLWSPRVPSHRLFPILKILMGFDRGPTRVPHPVFDPVSFSEA